MNMNKKYLKEGSTNPSDYENWEFIREQIGEDTMLSELFNYLSQDYIQGFIEHIDTYYELGLDVEGEDFYENKKFNDLVDRINEAVVKKIHEAGHIYAQDEEGNVSTNSKSTYRGVPNSAFIWHGEWADPEIIYNKKKLNYWDVDDVLWDNFKEFCEENNIEATEEEFDKWVTPEEAEEALRTCAFAEV